MIGFLQLSVVLFLLLVEGVVMVLLSSLLQTRDTSLHVLNYVYMFVFCLHRKTLRIIQL